MEKFQDEKPWPDRFVEVYDGIPESEGFDAVIADKQIEALLEIVNILGEGLAKMEEKFTKLYNQIKGNLSVVEEEDCEYSPGKITSIVQAMFS